MAKKTSFDVSNADGQKRLMAVSVGLDSETYIPRPIINESGKDYGADPMGNGMFKMVPSGDIVDFNERMRRLPMRK